MIVGISSRGEIYVSLLQSNSNASVMGIFFNSLVKKLAGENKYWYNSVVIQLDNALYHSSASTMKMFKELRVPVLFTGPHSYSASPVEYFFGAFKSKDVNPSKIKTGKR